MDWLWSAFQKLPRRNDRADASAGNVYVTVRQVLRRIDKNPGFMPERGILQQILLITKGKGIGYQGAEVDDDATLSMAGLGR